MTTTETQNRSDAGVVGPEGRPATGPGSRPLVSIETIAVGALFVALFAFLGSIVAIGLAARAIDEHRDVAAAIRAGGGGVSTVEVRLSEFAITPAIISMPAGGSLKLVNVGAIEHNVEVAGVLSPTIPAKGEAVLDLSSLAPGTYDIICEVPGHEASGMHGSLTVT